jgi:hypothetical protein
VIPFSGIYFLDNCISVHSRLAYRFGVPFQKKEILRVTNL